MGWRASLAIAAGVVRGRPALVAVGLLGFLARGGLVAFLLPIVALPTAIGIANFIGGTALTGSGASDGLIRLIAVVVSLVVGAVVLGAVLGAVADVLLAREALAGAAAYHDGLVTEHGRRRATAAAAAGTRVTPGLVGRLLVVRAIALLPVGLAVAWAATRLVAAGYHQLILPDDLALPLAVRILLEAVDAAVVVLVAWLLAEWVGGIAARHVIVGGRTAAAALGLALTGLVRRPLTSLATYGLGVVGVAIAAGPALLVAAVLWSRLQALLADNVPVLLLLPATFVFVLVWAGGLAAVGIVTAWRSVAGTLDVVRVGVPTIASLPEVTAPPDAPAGRSLPGVQPAAPEVALLEG
jgi:hypothetical protein